MTKNRGLSKPNGKRAMPTSCDDCKRCDCMAAALRPTKLGSSFRPVRDGFGNGRKKYGQQGLEGLKSQWQGENALKLSREQRADLKQRVEQYRPDQVMSADVRISRGQFWTVSDLQIMVKTWYEVEYSSVDSYRTLLHECGLSYQRTEKVYRSQPDAQTVADFEAELEKK